jgi:hypothetical protein
LLTSGFEIQERIQLLPNPNLHTMLHASDCVLGQLLAGPERDTSKGLIGGHDAAYYGYSNVEYKCVVATGFIHESYRCLDGSMLNVRVRGFIGIRVGKLRVPI